MMLYQNALTIMQSLHSKPLSGKVQVSHAHGHILAEDILVPHSIPQLPALSDWDHGLVGGGLLLKAGSFLNPERIMLLAALGFKSVTVRMHPRILAYAAAEGWDFPKAGPPHIDTRSGEHHREAGSQPSGLHDMLTSSTPYFQACCQALGLTISDAGQFDNKSSTLLLRIQEMALNDHPTLIITSGALTRGLQSLDGEEQGDSTTQSMLPAAKELGFDPLFHDIAIRPGKSIFLAKRGPHLWLGMSHHPVTACIAWNFFVRPLLASWALLPEPKTLTFKLKNQVSKPEHLRCFYRAEVAGQNVWINQRQGSTQLAATANMHAYIELPEGQSRFTTETKVKGLLI